MLKNYIGTKKVKAVSMDWGTYCEYMNLLNDISRSVTEEGYLVKCSDNYISWSPKKVFEDAYRESSNMTFGLAIEAMKNGKKVARAGWNGKGMYLYLADGGLLTEAIGDGSFPFTDSIVMKTADNKYCIGWLASQTDMLAEDWTILE